MITIWLFTVAAIIAGLGILFAYKRLMRGLSYRVKRNEFHYKGLQKDQLRFFIQVGLIEAIPIFLIIIGFTLIEPITPASSIIPILLILGVIFYGIQQIKRSNQNIKDETKELDKQDQRYVSTLSVMGYVLVLSIPFLSLIAFALVL